MSRLIVGLDIGTTSISAVAIDESGEMLGSVTRGHSASVPNLPAGHAEQDPATLLETALSVLRELCGCVNAGTICGIGLTGQMHSTVLLDEQQTAIGNIITWQDKRATEKLLDGSGTLLDELRDRCAAEDTRRSGCRLAPGFLGTTVFALQQSGEWPARCHKVSFVANWIVSQLTGEEIMTDRSHAASSGLLDLPTNRWNINLLTAAEVNPDWLPRIAAAGQAVGRVTDHMATHSGVPSGTLVGNAVGDNQAAVLSALPEGDDSLLINIGTGGQIVWRVSAFTRVDGMETRPLPGSSSTGPDDCFVLVGAGLVGGNSFAWINRTVRTWLAAFGVEQSEDEVWKTLAAHLQHSSETSGLTCQPFFSGTRPEPDRRGAFFGISPENFTPASAATAILHGIATSMHDTFLAAGPARPDPLHRIVMSGNASRHNPLLAKAVEDRFSVPTEVSPTTEEAATGAALLTGVRLGVWKDLEEGKARLAAEARSPTRQAGVCG